MGRSSIRVVAVAGLIGAMVIFGSSGVEAKKIKQSLKVVKEKTATTKSRVNSGTGSDSESYSDSNSDPDCDSGSNQHQLPADTISHVILKDGSRVEFNPASISFSGYEKEANASLETLLITNSGNVGITGVRFKIIYKDIKDRMLHSRTVVRSCHIPAHETRKIDFKSWDKQKSYFYYLGNEPRKVATPYKVEVVPLSFSIADSQ